MLCREPNRRILALNQISLARRLRNLRTYDVRVRLGNPKE